MPRVSSEGLLLGIAQIAVVIAGFTAVTSALRVLRRADRPSA